MKNIIIYLSLFLFCINFQKSFTQNTESLTEKTLVMLNDSSLTIQQGALFNIIEYDLIDTKNYLEENFWDIARSNQSLALRVLSHLNSNLTVNYAYRLIDTLEQNPYDQSKYFEAYQSGPFVPEELVEIADVLFSSGDFSKENYVFELAQVYSINKFSSKFIKPLSKMAKNSPTNSEIAKNLLTNIIFNAEDEYYRNDAIINLEAAIGSEIVPVLIQAYQEDSSSTNRFYLLNEYLSKYHNEFNADNLLKGFLLTETDKELRLHISKILLYGLGGIPNYIFVKEYLDEEPDTTIRTLMGFEVEEGVPALFDDNNTTEVCIDTMISITDQVSNLNWFGDLAFSNELKNILTTAKTILQNGDSLACREEVKAFQDSVDYVYVDSLNADPRFVTIEGWKFLYWNAQYILDRLPEPPANPNLLVNLKNSLGNQIPASNVKYYEGSWKDAVNNGDGTFTVITTRPTVSIRVFYEYASQQADNIPAQNNAYTFTTVNAAVQLKNSLGNFIDVGTVQYYSGAWRSFGTTQNGIANKELLPINYSFRMTYEYGSIDKQQDISVDPTVVFQTINAAVQLKNSLGNFIDVGIVQYYAGAWRSFGTTSNGVANKELLPINYSFRMTYEFVSKDKQQNLSTNPVVDFTTVLCTVKVSKTNNNQPINNATVKYYAGAWRNLGTTNADGISTKELLPANLSFRATYGSVSQDKQQDIGTNSLVEIQLNVP